MRISDWSSDVCSSDLLFRLPIGVGGEKIVPAKMVPWAVNGVGEKEPALVPEPGCGGAGGERGARGGRPRLVVELLAEIAELVARHRDQAPARRDGGAASGLPRSARLVPREDTGFAILELAHP